MIHALSCSPFGSFPQPAGISPRSACAPRGAAPEQQADKPRAAPELPTPQAPTLAAGRTLREVEEQFRLTLEEAPIGMALVGTDGRFLRVNRALCQILGYSVDELMALTFHAVTHPDDLDRDLALAGQLACGEIPRYTLEKRYIRKDGSIVHIELNGSVLRSQGGSPIHFIAQIQDVTERKRTEQEQLFLAELGPALTSSFDEDEIIGHVARLATRMLADFCVVECIEAGGRPGRRQVAARAASNGWMVEAIRVLQLDRVRPHLLSETAGARHALLLQQPSDAEVAALAQHPEHLRLLKAMRISSSLSVPLLIGDATIGAMALIGSAGSRPYDTRDVRLATEIAWRTAVSIERARLYRAAREATQARDDVLAIVAHDLRNPLNTIAMHATMLRRRAQPRAGLEGTVGEVIQRSTARMTRLIDDLLDVTRMEAGRLSVQPASVETSAFLTECVGSQTELARAAGIDLRLELPDGLPPVWADRDRLSQVLENLIGNALKFAGAGTQVTVGAAVPAHEVCFSVRDNGPGIPPEHLRHVFDRFWQARRDRSSGAGLGLPIVKGLVEAQRGRVWVESMPGAGACFFFTLPRADAARPGAQGTDGTG